MNLKTIFKKILNFLKIKSTNVSIRQIEMERAFLIGDTFDLFKLPKKFIDNMKYEKITNIYPQFSPTRYRISVIDGKTKYYSTIKNNLGLSICEEIEEPVSAKTIINVLNQPDTIILKKGRLTGEYDGYTYCIDHIDKYENSFYRLEVEKISNNESYKDDLKKLDKYVLPEFFTKHNLIEITGNKEYSNYNIAKKIHERDAEK